MTAAPVSVVVVSRGRPEPLARCLMSLAQQTYTPFEIVAVTDKAGRLRIDTMPAVYGRIKVVPCEEPNICIARNLGIAHAAGEVVAFIDDDAVAEPLWLEHLVRVFRDDRIDAATGYVVGRNGLSFQHRLSDIGPEGDSRPLTLEGTEPQLARPSAMRAIKTEGTNMAFRREVLIGLCGFDPAYRFYLDDSDLDIRMMRAGGTVAVVPLAQVHHGVAESERRRADRVPTSLFDVGASLAVFIRRHSYPENAYKAGRTERDKRRRGLLEHMVQGRLEPRDVNRLLASFDAGWSAGQERELAPLEPPDPVGEPFMAYVRDVPRRAHAVVSGRSWQEEECRAEALFLAEAGHPVTLFLLSPTSRYHRAWFDASGYWIQRGGLYGPSIRAGPFTKLTRFRSRIRHELDRLVPVRGRAIGDMDN